MLQHSWRQPLDDATRHVVRLPARVEHHEDGHGGHLEGEAFLRQDARFLRVLEVEDGAVKRREGGGGDGMMVAVTKGQS